VCNVLCRDIFTTRSQAVDRIADRTASQLTMAILRRNRQSNSNGEPKPLTKFEVSSSSSFEDMFDRMPTLLWGHVTWATSTFRENYLCARLALHIGLQSRVPNLKSLAQAALKILTLQWLS